jgi:hypothetical protein
MDIVNVVVQFDKEAIQTRGYGVAKNATHRADRPDPSLRKKRLLQDDNQIAPLPRQLAICADSELTKYQSSSAASYSTTGPLSYFITCATVMVKLTPSERTITVIPCGPR